MRRKSLGFILAILTLIVFSACSSNSGASATEVFEKGLEAAESLESAEIKTFLEQTMTMNDEDPFKTESEFVIQTTLDPLTLHQKGTTTMEIEGAPDEAIGIEMYLADEHFYLYEETADEWLEMGPEFSDLIEMMGAEQQDPMEQLEMFEEYVKEFSFEETDDAYVFNLEIDDDSADELFEELLEQSLPEEMEMMFAGTGFDISEDVDISQLIYEITFDKETYNMKTYDLIMDMTMEIEGMVLLLEQDIKTEYSKINEIDPIEVPQEVIDNAVDSMF